MGRSNDKGHFAALFAPFLVGALAVAPSDEGMFPFVIRPDAADSVADMRALVPVPAGRNGFLRRDGEEFFDGKGDRVRLNGVNLTGPAHFPTHADADRIALHLSRLGVNCVRLHAFDGTTMANVFQDPRNLLFTTNAVGKQVVDERMRDRLEYLIAALKKRGVYINMNLHVIRQLAPADGVRATCWANRGVNFFDRTLIAAEQAYAREILRHVNPYTGLALVDDPAMALVELTNENALMQVYWSDTIRNQGADPWYYDEFHRLREAAGYNATTNGINKFIVETEQKYFREMRAFLKTDLGVRCPVYGTQLDYTAPWSMADTCEAVDVHIYWNHPSWESPKWSYGRVAQRTLGVNWKFRNCAISDAELTGDYGNPIVARGARRVKGLPYITTEAASPYPCWYGAEYQPMLHAYASFQRWAGVFAYTWNNEPDGSPECNAWFFSHSARSDAVAHFPACAALFLRGDAAQAIRRIDIPADRDKVYRQAAFGKEGYLPLIIVDAERATDGAVANAAFLEHAVAIDLDGKAKRPASVAARATGRFESDTREIVLDRTADSNSVFIVNTPNVRFLSGHTDGRRFDLGGVVFAPGQTKLGWSAVSLLSQKGDGVVSGSRLLLAATGYTHNGGATFKKLDGVHWGGVTEAFGTGKMVTEGVPLTVTLPVGAAKCWALDESGARKAEVPVAVRDGKAEIAVGPEYKTVWYEIAL